MKKLVLFAVLLAQLVTSVAFAFPTKEQIHTQRVQLERVRRYAIHQFLTDPRLSSDQETVDQVIRTVMQLDMEILRLAFFELHRDQIVAEQEAAAKAGAQ